MTGEVTRVGVAEVATIAVREAGKPGTVTFAEGKVGSNLADSRAPHHVPLSAAEHEPLISSFGCPQATPLTHDLILLRDDVVDLPGRIEEELELTPVLREVLCPVYRLESVWQEVVNYIRGESWQQVTNLPGVAPIEVAKDDSCVLLSDR